MLLSGFAIISDYQNGIEGFSNFYEVHAGARKHKMKGTRPSMTKEIWAKARSASRSRRERSAQTRGELQGRVGRLASGGRGGRSFSAARPKGKGGE